METAQISTEPTLAPEPVATDQPTSGLAEAISRTHYRMAPDEPAIAPQPESGIEPASTPEPVPETPAQPEQPETPASPMPTSAPAQDPSLWLQEQTGGKLKDAESLKTILQDPISLLPEHEQQLIKVARSGMDPMEYQRLQSTDFNAMEPRDVLRHDFLAQNKHIPDNLKEAAFNRFLNSKYPNLEGFGEDDQDSQLDNLALQHEANQVRAKHIKQQEEMRLIPAAEKQPEAGMSPEEIAQRTAAHLAAVEEALKLDQLTFEVKSGEETRQVPLKLSQEDLRQALTEPDQFILQRWANPDGSHNYAAEQRDIATLQNLPKLLQAAFEQGLSAKESNVLRTLENPAPSASIAAPSTEPDKAALAAAIAAKYQTTGTTQFARY